MPVDGRRSSWQSGNAAARGHANLRVAEPPAGLIDLSAAAGGSRRMLSLIAWSTIDDHGRPWTTLTARWLAEHRDLWLTHLLFVITQAGSPARQAVLVLIVCALAARRARSWLPVVLGLVGAGGIGLVVITAKTLVGRQRPAAPYALISAHGFSFPSGHATGARPRSG